MNVMMLRQLRKLRSLRNGASMKVRLLAGFGIVLVIFVCAAAFNLHQMNHIKKQMAAQNGKVDLKLMALELKELVQEMNIIASGLEISKNPEYIDKYNEMRKQYNDMVKSIGDTASTDDQRRWRSQLISASNDYISNFDTAARLIKEGNMKQADLDNNMVYLYGESQKLRGVIFGIVDQFYNVYAQQAQDAVTETYGLLDNTSAIMVAAASFVLLVTLAVALLLNRSFVRPIRRLQQAVSLIAAGDLRHKIGSSKQDELGQLSRSFDQMVDQVRDMLSSMQLIASSLYGHSDAFYRFSQTTAAANADIVQAIEHISRGADQQASRAEQSSSVIAVLEHEIAGIADYTGLMLASSREAARNTERGTAAVKSLQTAARQGQDMLERAAAEMASFAASSEQIRKITGTITDISSQTHVLALNAAIEAARAGAHGRGFSVIAEQVRNLAEETNRSSKTIAHIIAGLQRQMRELQEAVRTAAEAAAAQTAQVDETFASFTAIADSMESMSGQIRHIHERIELAKTKNESLVTAVQQVAAIAEETAAGVQQVGSASAEQDASIRRIAAESEEIRTLARRLFAEISKFRLADGEGGETGAICPDGTEIAGGGNDAGERRGSERNGRCRDEGHGDYSVSR
jgi:methyl-accepting chemotaxis protein